MHIDPLEKIWVWTVGAIIVAMLAIIFYTAFAQGVHPPSNVETIDSARLHLTEEFAEDNLGVKTNPDGSVTLTMVATRYGFYPQHVEIPVDTPVKMRVAATDVLHGFHIEGTNLATMVVPGFVSEVNGVFKKTGLHAMFCNEYCGYGHHYMWSRINAVERGAGTS